MLETSDENGKVFSTWGVVWLELLLYGKLNISAECSNLCLDSLSITGVFCETHTNGRDCWIVL